MRFHSARGGKGLALLALLALSVAFGAFSAVTADPGGGGARPVYPPHAPGEILIKFRSTAGPSERANARALVGGSSLRKFRSGAEHWKTGANVTTEEAIARLRGNPHVAYVEPNYLVTASAVPNDPSYPLLWGLHNTGAGGGLAGADIDAEPAWDITTGSRTVLVGIIDTGIDYNHPDLAANIWTNPGEIAGNHIDDDHNGFVDDIHGWDFVNNDNDPYDDHYHGTHVAGTIGGVGNNGVGVVGVNWKVSLVALKFLDAGGHGTTAAAIAAVDYATAMHLDMTNNSWGGGGFSQALYDAIVAAGAANSLFVAAAGNSGANTDLSPNFPSGYDAANIVAVAATDYLDRLASFSNFGPTTVDLGAPGVDIYSAAPGGLYQYLDGTSMAAPHVTGVAALMRAVNPGLDVAALKRALLDSVDPLTVLAGKTVSGGRLNALRALASLDQVPPGPIEDLVLTSPTSSTVTLTWTATGDDGVSGTAAAYDVRYATTPIDETTFDAALRGQGAPDPQPFGSTDTMELAGLTPGTTYYIAIKAVDDGGNSGPISNVVTGTTLPAPTFASTPAEFSLTLFTGEIATRTLTIANAGVGTLDWIIPTPSVSGALAAQQAPMTLAKGQPDPRAGTAGAPGSRGPDAFGYRITDSDEPGGPTFSWYDLAASGTPILSLGGDDQISEPLPIGFDFPFYGGAFSAVRVGTNGFLSFTSDATDFTNQPLPGAASPGNLIAAFWDDLDFSAGGRAYYARAARSFTVQFVGVRPYAGAGAYDFEVTLRDSGEILFQYRSMTGPLDGATIGIQDGTRTIDVQAAFNAAYAHDNLAVSISAVPQWLSADPTQGRLAEGQHQDVAITIDAAGLHGGTHPGAVVVQTNDPLNPSVTHPVTLTVIDAPTINVAPASLDFGTVFMGFGASQLLTVENTGTAELNAQIIPGDPAVTLSATTLQVAAGRSVQVGVTFTALTLGTFASSLAIESDAPNNPHLEVPITASAAPAPGIVVDPSSYSEYLLTGGTLTRNLRVTNPGGSDLVLNATAELWPATPPSSATQGLALPAVVNGGFEEGTFRGWIATSNGRGELSPWRVGAAGSDYFGASSPSEGRYYALNGFDGEAGLVYDLYQAVEVPAGTVQADVLFDDRIQYDSLGIGSSQPRIYEAWIEDPNGATLTAIVREEIWLNGAPYTDTGWRHRSVSIAAWAGRTVRIHIRETIPETYTGPASLELDGFRIEAQAIPAWLAVAPATATIPPGESRDFTVTFDAGNAGTTVFSGAVRLETNIPATPTVRVPALLSVTGAPNIAVSGETVTIESSRTYAMSGATTTHDLTLTEPPAGTGVITLVADGDYGFPGETATAVAEGLGLFTVGGQSGLDCTPASASVELSSGDLATLASDGVVHVEVRNSSTVDYFCSTNMHTVRLAYATSANRLDYGSFFVGLSRSRSITISNQGNDLLQVGSISSDRLDFVPSVSSLLLDPGASAEVTVTFTPPAAGAFDGTLTIQSNDADTPLFSIPLAGVGLEPPVASVTPAALESTLFSGGQETQTLTLVNDGGSPLDFSVSVRLAAPSGGRVLAPFAGLSPVVPGASNNPSPAPHAGDPPAPNPGDESYTGVPGEFELLHSSTAPLTCFVEDRDAGFLYAQANAGTGFFRYRASSDAWELLAPSPVNSGNNGGAALLNGRIYTAYTGNGLTLGVYDIAGNSWSTIPNPLGGGTGNIASDGVRYLYLVVGSVFVRLDPVTSTTTSLATPPFLFEPWGGMRILDGVLYAHQGNGTAGFASYDIAANRWTVLPSLPGGAVLGAAIDPFDREYYAYGSYGGTNLYHYSIDTGAWSVSSIPFFAVNDGGVGWLPFPVAGVYFLQGEGGSGLARLVTGPGFLAITPTTGSVPPRSSMDLGALFDARNRLGGTYTADVVISSNDPVNPQLTVPATLTVIGAPDMQIRGDTTTIESTRSYTTSGAMTSHALALPTPSAGDGAILLTVNGDYGYSGETATATAEGITLGVVGGTSGYDCSPASATFPLSAATLAALAADGVVHVDVQNSVYVDVFCSINQHTVRLSYYAPADRLDFGAIFVGASRTLNLVIANVGTDRLHVGPIASSHPDFTPAVAAFELAPGESRNLEVIFRPGSAAALDGVLTLASDDPDQTLVSLPLTGTGLVPPVIGVQPLSLDATLPSGSTESRTLTIANDGGSPLNFTLSLQAVAAGAVSVPFIGLWPETAGASNNPEPTQDLGNPPSPAPGDESYLGLPGEFERLQSSTVPLTCVVEDRDTGIIYAQGNNATSFFRYRAATNAWEPLAAAPIHSGNNGGAALLNGKIYTTYTTNSLSLGVYDIASNSWSTMASPLGFGSGNIASDGDRFLYLVGSSTLVRFEPATSTKTTLSAPPFWFEPWGGMRFLGGVLYAHQGNGRSGFASYDIATNTWTVLPSVPLGAVLGAAIDPYKREYYAYGSYSGINLYRYSIDARQWSVASLPFFSVNDGGLAWLPAPVSGLYFVEGELGIGFARLITDLGFLKFSPAAGTVAANSSTTIDILFDATNLAGGSYSGSLNVSSNDPLTPVVAVPVTLTIFDVPNMFIAGAPLSMQSVQAYSAVGATTSHMLRLPGAPDGAGELQLAADGDYQSASQSASVSAEGLTIGSVGGTGVACGRAMGAFTIPAGQLAAMGADGLLSLEVRNTASVGSSCALNLHTLWLTYPIASDHLDFGTQAAGSTQSLGLTITNKGTGILHIASIASNHGAFVPSASSFDIARNQSVTLNVAFAPPSSGAYSGTLSLESDDFRSPHLDIPLSGIAVDPPVLGVQPAALESSLYPEMQEEQILTVTNAGAGPLHVAVNSVTTDHVPFLSTSPASGVVAPGGFLNVTVRFDARLASIGMHAGAVLVSSDDLLAPLVTVPVSLHVIGRPALTLTTGTTSVQSTDSFAPSGSRTSHALAVPAPPGGNGTFELTAEGNFQGATRTATATIEGFGIGSVGGIAATCGVASQIFTIPMSQLSAFAADGVVQVDVQNSSSVFNVCTLGRHTVRLSYHQPLAAIDFGPTFIGARATRSFFIENTGTDDLIVSSIAGDPSWFTASPSQVTLAPGAATTIVATFTAGVEGTLAGLLTFTSNDTVHPGFALPLTGSGVRPPIVGVQPASLSSTLVPGSHEIQALTLSNTGASPLHFALSVATPGASFLSVGPVSGEVPAGGSLDAAVSFDARLTPIGTYAGSVLVSSDDPVTPLVTVPVSLHVLGKPSIDLSSGTTTVESSLSFHLTGGRTVHNLDLPSQPGGNGALELIVDGDFQGIGHVATASIEGTDIGSVGGSPSSCGRASRTFLIPKPQLDAFGADGIVQTTVLNAPAVSTFCTVSSHTVRLTYHQPLDSLDYGPIMIGGSSSRSFYVENTGTDLLEVPSITSDSGLFTVSPPAMTVEPGATATIVVTFSPDAAGAVSGLLTFTSNDPDRPGLTIPMTGVGSPPPVIGVTPASLDATVRPPDQTTQTLTIENTGGLPLSFSILVPPPAFAIVTPSTGTVAPSSALSVNVVFDPAFLTPGAHATTIEIASNDPLTPLVVIPAGLYVLGQPFISIQQPPITAQSVKTYTAAGARTIHRFNLAPPPASGAELNLVVEGDFGDADEVATVSVESLRTLVLGGTGGACGSAEARVSLSRDDMTALMADGSLIVRVQNSAQVDASCPVSRHTVNVTYIPVAELIDFGAAFTGATVSRTIVIENQGTDALVVGSITSDQPGLTATPDAFTLPPDGVQTVTLRLTLSSVGDFAGSLTIASNDPVVPEAILGLFGSGLPAPILDVRPASLTSALVTGQAETQTLTIANPGGGDLVFSAAVSSATTPPFLTISPDSGTVAPGGSAALSVRIDSAGLALGSHSAALEIASNDPLATGVVVPVSLTVIGLPDIAVSGDEIAVESAITYSTEGARTFHHLVLPEPPASAGTLSLAVQGEYGDAGATAAAEIEGVPLGTVGGVGGQCALTADSFPVGFARLAAAAVDGAIDVTVQNTVVVGASCAVNSHTVGLTYRKRADAIDFGQVFPGFEATRTLLVENRGSATLNVTSVTADRPEYTIAFAPLAIEPGGSAILTIAMMPGGVGPAPGALRIESDDPDTASMTVPLTAMVVLPPIAGLEPGTVVAALPPGGVVTRTLRIANTGESDLVWSLGGPGTAGPGLLPAWVTAAPTSGTIVPGAWTDITVTLAAALLADGDHAQTLSVYSNDPVRPRLDTSLSLHVGEIAPDILVVEPATLNLSSNGLTIRASLQLPAALDPHNVVVATVLLNGALSPIPSMTSFADENGDGVPEMILKFDRAAFEAIVPEGPSVPMTLTGEVRDQTWFRGTTAIRAIRPQLTSPNGGEFLLVGQPSAIVWNPAPASGSVSYSVILSRDGGATWESLATNLSALSLDWVPSGPETSRARIRILATDNKGVMGYDTSDADITIAGSLTPPHGVETLQVALDAGGAILLAWSRPGVDTTHGPASHYRVLRSSSPDGGFVEIGTPASETFTEPAANEAGIVYYKVVAVNAAGESTD